MTTIDDLEAQLRDGLDRGIDRDVIVVYADQLQALNDPRGELIVIDLEIEHSGPTPALTRRRGELIDTWLGAQRPNGTIRYGFVELDATSADPVEQVRTALGSKAARFIRSITAVGPPKQLQHTLEAITEAPRPFLARVTLRQWNEKAEPSVPLTGFARALPNLQCLEVDARKLATELEHPTLRRLRLSGFDAFAEVDLPELVELDLALHCHLATARSAPKPAFYSKLGAGMPKLVALDLSRNEPGYLDPYTLGGESTIFGKLPRLGCRDRLEKLVLPSPADDVEIASIRSAILAMPRLRELSIPRAANPELLTANLGRDGLTITF